MERPYYVIDVFTSERFAGNPAAVVLNAENLSGARMQRIAAEFNLSETTFILPPENLRATGQPAPDSRSRPGGGGGADCTVRFRWFTPLAEVAMCGHATIAGIHALLEPGDRQPPLDILSPQEPGGPITVRIETLSGLLTAFVEPMPGQPDRRMIWLALRPPKLTAFALDRSALSRVLRLEPDAFEPTLPAMTTQDADLIVAVRDMMTLHSARPDFGALSELLSRKRLRGLSLATANVPNGGGGTVTPSISLQSRFFCPNLGVDEDPVTGSVHGPLAAYLLKHGLIPVHDGQAGFLAVQGKPGGRTGLIWVLVRSEEGDTCSVRIAGEAVTTMRGVLVE